MSPANVRVLWWAAFLAFAFGLGGGVKAAGGLPLDGLPPLYAHARPPPPGIVLPIAAAAGLVMALPGIAAGRAWRTLLAVSWPLAALWALALAASDGLDAIAAPLDQPTEYLVDVPSVGDDPVAWVGGFTDALPGYATHVKGHPPLPVLLLWALDRIGLHGPGWAAALVIAVGASAAPAIALTVRSLADEEAARRALPFLILAPYALWVATSMDAVFLGVGAWGVAFLARRRSFLAGLLLGALPYLSYGLVPFAVIPLAVAVLRRPSWTALALGLAIVPAGFTLAGFWWPDGAHATQRAWAAGAGSDRPYAYFLGGDLAVLGLLTGPAAIAARHQRAAVRVLVAAALCAVIALDLSGVTRGEVERIWLPYAPWIVLAAAGHRPPARAWLAAQAGTAVLLQALAASPW